MPITWGEAKTLISQYAGRGGQCPSADKVDLFVRQVLDYMLISGEYGNLRKFCFNAVKGCFTIPYELEVPLKIKIDEEVGSVWDKWFEFYNTNNLEGDNCFNFSDAAFEDPNYYPTVYELPGGGANVGVVGTCSESESANIIIQGIDTTGREVYTNHKGMKVSGEYLSIVKNEMRYTTTEFSKITGVLKTKTNGYTPLYWLRPKQNLKGFLSDYAPLEEKPSYRRFRIRSSKCGNCVKVSILGRIRLRAAYADTDYIPFDSLYTLELAAQAVNANYNNDVATAGAKDKMMVDLITRTNEYKRVQVGQPIEVFHPTSPGAITNIVGGFLGRRR